MAGVWIECLPWQVFIKRWGRPGMLFYLNPPYYGNEADYGRNTFTRDDFAQMAMILKDLQGAFILSLNDRRVVRETFSDFQFVNVDCTYSVERRSQLRYLANFLSDNFRPLPPFGAF